MSKFLNRLQTVGTAILFIVMVAAVGYGAWAIPEFSKALWEWTQSVAKGLAQALLLYVVFCLLFRGFFHEPYRLIVKSSFPNDDFKWRWNWRSIRRKFLFFSGLHSQPSIQRFVYLARNPYPTLRPAKIYRRAQLYIENEQFTHRDESNSDDESHSEEVTNKYLASAKARAPVPIICESCFDIFERKDDIKRYFTAQQEVSNCARYLSPIQFKSGYLAPTYLISGPLAEFDEDWPRIVNAYREKMAFLAGKDPLKNLSELRKLQSFIWDCWVQWGPSVPIARSRQWTSGPGAPQLEVALQFGYGDENNSLPMCWIGNGSSTSADKGKTFDDWEKSLSAVRAEAATGAAWPVRASGYLKWLKKDERNSRICYAQQDTKITTIDGGLRGEAPTLPTDAPSDRKAMTTDGGDTDRNWMVFEAATVEKDESGPLFYSAYVWVLIAVCRRPIDSNKVDLTSEERRRGYELVHKGHNEHWRGLIPFFLHGNIAEPSVYEDIKRQLAIKTIDSLIHELARARTPLPNGDLRNADWLEFAFVAAFDDNGDHGSSRLVAPQQGMSIRDLMEQELLARANSITHMEHRIHLAPDAVEELTACNLPSVVQGYLDYLK